jgi:hypothetical protein
MHDFGPRNDNRPKIGEDADVGAMATGSSFRALPRL